MGRRGAGGGGVVGRIFSALIFSFIATKILAVVPRIDMPGTCQLLITL